jgi:hypothetical protein
LILCILILLLAFSFDGSPASNAESGGRAVQPPQDDPEANKPHWLVGSYYSTRDGLTATLLLNNKGGQPLEVQPTIYDLKGQAFEIPPLTVEAGSFRFVNLQEWAASAGESFSRGSVKLFHVGKDLVLGAQIHLTDEAHRLAFEEKLAGVDKFDSRRFEGVWWMPSRQADVQVVLSNTTDAPLPVTARLGRKPHHTGEPRAFNLAAHETRVLHLKRDFAEGEQFAAAEVVALSLEHAGAKSALLARAMVSDEAAGYSNVVQFSNPDGGKSSEYQGVGFRVDEVAGEQLVPVIVARNVGVADATARARVPYTRADGTTGVIDLGPTKLRPGEMRLIDARKITQRSRQEQIAVAGLEVEYDTTPGSIIVNAHSVGAGGDQVFRVPMWDPLGQRSPTGGYPWRIEGSSTTMIYIKNITGREQYYVASLRWTGGDGYMLGMKRVAPNQTVEIDIRRLRDEQVADADGRVIPADLSAGQLMWSLKQVGPAPAGEKERQALALIGRSEQIDVERGVSSNYSCQNCCSDSYYDSWLSPGSGDIEVNTTLIFEAKQRDKDCYGSITLPYTRAFYDGPTHWSSSDTATATVSDGWANGVGAGETTIKATWEDYRYDLRFAPCFYYEGMPGGPNCNDCNNPQTVYPAPTATLQVRPRITITRDGTAVTSAQNVIVGQQISLAATVVGGTPSSHQWSVPGVAVEGYDVVCNVVGGECQGPTSGAVIPLTSLSNSSVQHYWVDGGDNRQVQYTVTVRGREYSRAVTFNVKRPTAQVSSPTGSVQLTTTRDGYGLWFGNLSQPGIAFSATVTVPSGFTGETQWVQTWNKFRRVQQASSGRWFRSSGSGLDTLYPYSAGETANDTPGLAFSPDFSAVAIDESFRMWLMFKPTGVSQPTIWVPLRVTDWGWTGSASLSGSTWVLNSGNKTVGASTDTTTHPLWTRNALLIPYSLEP